jgi:hypothetical protein
MSDEIDNNEEPLVTWTDRAARISFISLAISFVIHAAIMGTAYLSFDPDAVTELDVEWFQNFDDLQGVGASEGRFAQIEISPKPEPAPEPEPKPEPKPEPEPEPEIEAKPTPKPKPKPKDPKPAADVAKVERQDLKKNDQNPFEAEELPGMDRSGPSGLPAMEGYGPGNAIFSALLRLDRVRGTAFEEPVRKIMELVPDYRIALENTGVDPINDLNSMFMASAQPQYLQQTFLAVRHNLSDEAMKTALDGRFEAPMQWRPYRGIESRELVPDTSRYQDPRKILLARPGLAVLARPEWLPQLTDELPEDSELRSGSEAKVSMIDGLEQIERTAPEDTLLLMSAHGAMVILPGLGKIRFDSAKVSISNVDAPLVKIDMLFGTPQDAARFADACPTMKERLIAGVPFLARGTVANLVNRVECRQKDNFTTLTALYTTAEITQVLNFGTALVPRPPALSQLPNAPLPKPQEAPQLKQVDTPTAHHTEESTAPTAHTDADNAPREEPPTNTPELQLESDAGIATP